jgi:hypothetical protein
VSGASSSPACSRYARIVVPSSTPRRPVAIKQTERYYLTGALVLQRDMIITGHGQDPAEVAGVRDDRRRQRVVGAAQTPGAMRDVGVLFMLLLVVDHVQGGDEVKHRLGQRRAEEEANLHRAQVHRLGWEQHQPVVGVTQRIGGIWSRRQRFMQERAERGVGTPLAG